VYIGDALWNPKEEEEKKKKKMMMMESKSAENITE